MADAVIEAKQGVAEEISEAEGGDADAAAAEEEMIEEEA